MGKNPEWEKVGGGSYGVYRPKKKPFSDKVGEVLGLLFICFVVGALLTQCAG